MLGCGLQRIGAKGAWLKRTSLRGDICKKIAWGVKLIQKMPERKFCSLMDVFLGGNNKYLGVADYPTPGSTQVADVG